MRAELRAVTGRDVVERSGGVVVVVSGPRARIVPARAEFHARLLGAARFAADGFLIGGTEPRRKNLTTPLISSLAGGRHLQRLDTGRLRATWLAKTAETIGLRAFMDAAGVVCSQRLRDIVSYLDAVPMARAVTLLGGRW